MRMGAHRRAAVALAVAVLCAGVAPMGRASAASGSSFGRVRVFAAFLHTDGQGGVAYAEVVAGSSLLSWEPEQGAEPGQGAATLAFPLGFGDRPCGMSMSWLVPAEKPSQGGASGGVEMCLGAAGASVEALEHWIRGRPAGQDPTFIVPLLYDAKEDAWVNEGDVEAAVFVRGPCGSDVFRRYADMRFGHRALRLVPEADGSTLLVFGPVTITETRPDAWEEIPSCGNQNVPLPVSPTTGSMKPVRWIPEAYGERPPDRIAELRDEVARLAHTEAAAREDGAALVDRLDRARALLAEADPITAMTALRDFEALASGAPIDPKIVEPLIAISSGARAQITDETGPPSPISDPEDCPARPQCSYEVLYVDGNTLRLGVPDGSEARPFGTIGQALAAAIARGACGVEIRVAGPATYRETLTITLPTTIVGLGYAIDAPTLAGSVLSDAGAQLEVRNFRITGPTDPRGAVAADHPCSAITLEGVAIEGATNFGIHQRGGTLRTFWVSVRNTEATPGSRRHGAGIVLVDVLGLLGRTQVFSNASGGLLVEGAGAHVIGERLSASANRASPSCVRGTSTGIEALREAVTRLSGYGGVVATGGARLDLLYSIVADNVGFGAFSTDAASLSVESSTIRSTRLLPDGACAYGGWGALVHDGGSLELRTFSIQRSGFVGLTISGTSSHEVYARDGTVSHNPIAVNIQTCEFDRNRIRNNVRFPYNDINLDSLCLDVPEPSPELEL